MELKINLAKGGQNEATNLFKFPSNTGVNSEIVTKHPVHPEAQQLSLEAKN